MNESINAHKAGRARERDLCSAVTFLCIWLVSFKASSVVKSQGRHLNGPEEIYADGDHGLAHMAAPVDDAMIAHSIGALPPD